MSEQLKKIYLESCLEELKINKPGNHSLNSNYGNVFREVCNCFKNFSKIFSRRKPFSGRNDFSFN